MLINFRYLIIYLCEWGFLGGNTGVITVMYFSLVYVNVSNNDGKK